MGIVVVPSDIEVIERLTLEIQKCAQEALEQRKVFRVGLSGGSVLNYLCTAIPRIVSDFSKWRFFFCDERYVDESDGESTYGAYKRTLIPKTTLQEQQFFSINTELPLQACAADYERRILEEFQLPEEERRSVPQFDLLLLGMGPDGHTCSLFPDHELLQEQQCLVAAIADSPKPPPKRVTMTFPLINQARCCIFAMCGSGKAEMVKRIFVDKEALPAGLVKPKNGRLICILDEAAGAPLS